MFERYTDTARNAILFARDEALKTAGDCIEASHIFLGLLHSDQTLLTRWCRSESQAGAIKREVRACLKYLPESTRTIGGRRFSRTAKDVLRHAAMEADRANHYNIGCEHILVALLKISSPLDGIAARYGLSYGQISKH